MVNCEFTCNVSWSFIGEDPGLFLTQIEWDLTLILTSHIKVRNVSSFGQYMYSEYIRVVQIEKERVWIFNAEIYAFNIHPRRLSILFVDLPRWFCFVLLFSIVLFQFNFVILSYSAMIVTHVDLFSAVVSVLRVDLCFNFDYNLAILPLLVNCKFDRLIFICFVTFLPWISTLYLWHPLKHFSLVCLYSHAMLGGRTLEIRQLSSTTFSFVRCSSPMVLLCFGFLVCFLSV